MVNGDLHTLADVSQCGENNVQLADIHMIYMERDFPSSHRVWCQLVTRGWKFLS